MDDNRFEVKSLVINTRESLYEPIEITIDGNVYQSKKMTRAVMAEVNKLDDEKPMVNDEVLYKIILLLFDVDAETLDKLDKREVQDIYLFVKKKFNDVEQERLKLVISTFGGSWQPGTEEKKKVTERIPKNRKRSGSKA